ncbi:MAG TPA: hypothetical protein VE995_01645 [Gaiellaceae bacterium]|nr:hypothetical protein [Gaiellaceae bacterium]
MRRAAAAAVLGAAAASIPGAAAAGGLALSASPLRLTLAGASAAVVTVRNPGRRTVVVDVSRAGFARSLRGRPRVRPARGAAAWLRLRPRRVVLAPGGSARVRVRAAPPGRAEPGDHPALVLLTTRPVGSRRVRMRLRVGVVVVLRVAGRIVRRLDPRSLRVERRGRRRLLELRLVNRGNVSERLGRVGLRLVLARRGRRLATLRPKPRELLPHSAGLVEFVYRGPARGPLVARVELAPALHARPRVFRIRL